MKLCSPSVSFVLFIFMITLWRRRVIVTPHTHTDLITLFVAASQKWIHQQQQQQQQLLFFLLLFLLFFFFFFLFLLVKQMNVDAWLIVFIIWTISIFYCCYYYGLQWQRQPSSLRRCGIECEEFVMYPERCVIQGLVHSTLYRYDGFTLWSNVLGHLVKIQFRCRTNTLSTYKDKKSLAMNGTNN